MYKRNSTNFAKKNVCIIGKFTNLDYCKTINCPVVKKRVCLFVIDNTVLPSSVGSKFVGSDFSTCGKWYCKSQKTWWNVFEKFSKHVCSLSKHLMTLLGQYFMKKLNILKNKSAGGGPWPPTWVTSQNHGAKTIFLLVHIPF